MFENSTTDEIINALEPIIPDRISGKVYVDGVLIVDTESQSVVDIPVSSYDEFGFSQPDSFGCVRIEKVDERIAAWLGSDNEFRRKVAQEQSQWFGILLPGWDYDDEVDQRIWRNTAYHAVMSARLGGPVIEGFRFYNSRYVHLETGELKNSLTSADRRTRKWGRNENYQGDIIPNHSSVAWGNLAKPDHPSWATRFVPEVAKDVLDRMRRKAHSLQKQAEREADGVVAPDFGL